MCGQFPAQRDVDVATGTAVSRSTQVFSIESFYRTTRRPHKNDAVKPPLPQGGMARYAVLVVPFQ